jgi:16S rRNA (cytidine1402-2'-O)-methyltransferase
MAGTLYLIPNALGEGALDTVIPDPVRARTASLQYFIAENAKSARAFLKQVNATHPLQQPLQETHISELNVNTPAEQLPGLLTPLRQGHDVGLLSEAGVPAVADPGADIVGLFFFATGADGERPEWTKFCVSWLPANGCRCTRCTHTAT